MLPFSGKYDVKFQTLCLHIISDKKCLPPPKLNKLLRLYGPAYLHAGESIPPTTMALSPFSRLPPFPPRLTPTHRTPSNNFWTFYTQFCAILCVFSVNFASWQSGILTPKKWKTINGVGKHKLRIKTQSSERSEWEMFLRKWWEDYIKKIHA